MYLCFSGLIMQLNENLVCKLWMNNLTKRPFPLQMRELGQREEKMLSGGTHAPLYESVRKREGEII